MPLNTMFARHKSHKSVEVIDLTKKKKQISYLHKHSWTEMHFATSMHSFYFVPGMLIFALFGTFAAITISFRSCFQSWKIWPLFPSQRK